MKWMTYNSMQGLERVPAHERYRTWRSIHENLVRGDPEYRRRVRRNRSQIVIASVIYCGIFIVPFLASGIAPKRQWVAGAVWGVATLWFVAFILYASFGLQEYENEHVGKELERKSASNEGSRVQG